MVIPSGQLHHFGPKHGQSYYRKIIYFIFKVMVPKCYQSSPLKSTFFFFSYNQPLRGYAKKYGQNSVTYRTVFIFPHNLSFCFSHKFSIQIPNFVIKKFQLDSSFKKHVHQFLLNFHFYLRSIEVHGRHVQDISTPNLKKILLLYRCTENFCYSCYKCADISCFEICNSYF